jgi:hypothetical protein
MNRRAFVRGAAGATLAVLLSAQAVWADDISNNLDASIDAVAEVMALNVGGVNGSTTLYVTPRVGDGKSGCNLTGSTTLVISVATSNAGVATVSPASITFGSCGDTPALTIHPVAAGSASITVSQTSNDTGGTFNLTSATFTVNVAPSANSAPIVTITGVAAGGSYELGSVPTAGCSVTDAEDGNSTFGATLSAVSGPLLAFGLGTVTASCSYTDGGGLIASASATYSIVDTGDPVISFVSRLPAANGNGWNGGDVTVTWSCSDGTGSGVVQSLVSQTVNAEGANQSVTGTCTDNAGNTASDTVTGISLDTTDPVITLESRLPAANGNGWNNGDVTVTWSCADVGGSGVVAPQDQKTVATEGENQSASGTCTDLADNTASDTQTGISIDKTDPGVTDLGAASGTAGSNGWYVSSVVNEFQATDNLSGFPGLTKSILVSTGTSEGSAVEVSSGTISDLAGNDIDGIDSAAFKIDLSNPTDVAFSSVLSGSYYFGSVPAAPTCSATDAISGLASCIVSGYETAVGSHTLTALATDNAGRTSQIQTSYTVLAWTLTGFYQPVDMNGILNTVKAGSTVPLKFEVFAGTTELTDVSVVSTLVKTATCTTGLPEDTIEVTATGGTSLRYDTTGGLFVFNWQTPKLTGRCYNVVLTTSDLSELSTNFKLK